MDPEYRARRAAIMRKVKFNRRRRLRAAFVEVVDPQYIFQRDQGVCQICRKRVRAGEWSLDHIIPLSRGGTHETANVRLAHKRCNSRKWANAGPGGDQLLLLG
ncbi:HNH endonuclease [Nonomuraea phyllanthi]|uniref:HNH endonuclease n=1 Tax=Nonomuraea phyllanthi TaxID=2219224 RepID=UPI00186AFFB4|nr:HNH endonuclease [Nonomuraea phyllanthi]